MALKTNSRVVLFSSDRALEEGFDRVKQQALYWVFEDGDIGPSYEAALPGREAFCMRDVSHQCIGAEVLGLQAHNKNMMRRFAAVPCAETDWCSWWEIDRYGRPCPVDFTSNRDFWYNLPANFDVIDAIYRLYRFSGDGDYLNLPEIRHFVATSLENYVARWDRDGDGIPDRVPSDGRRGLSSYDESDFAKSRVKVGGDLIAIQARGTLSAAEMYGLRGQKELKRIYERRGAELVQRTLALRGPERGFAEGIGFENERIFTGRGHLKTMLYYHILPCELAREAAKSVWAEFPEMIIERACHVPEILFDYGMKEEALQALRAMVSPSLHRREYPEASFATVGAFATGLMGVAPNAALNEIATLSGLPDDMECALLHVPACGAELTVNHRGANETLVRNESGAPFTWKACFRGAGRIEGRDSETQPHPYTGEALTFAKIPLWPGEEAVCRFLPA